MAETPEGRTISPSMNRHTSMEMDQVSKDFMEFLKSLHKPGREILKQCRVFLMNVSSKKVRGGLLRPAVATAFMSPTQADTSASPPARS